MTRRQTEKDGILRLQLTISLEEYPRLFRALSRMSTGQRRTARIIQLASLGEVIEAMQTGLSMPKTDAREHTQENLSESPGRRPTPAWSKEDMDNLFQGRARL